MQTTTSFPKRPSELSAESRNRWTPLLFKASHSTAKLLVKSLVSEQLIMRREPFCGRSVFF